MKIIVPDNWAELTPWQQREIIHIIQNTDTEDFTEQYIRIVQILLMKEDNVSEYAKMRRILRQIPISAFKEAVQFLWEKPTLVLLQSPKQKGAKRLAMDTPMKDANHYENRTRNLKLPSGEIKKINILFIEEFNGKKVVY